MPTLETPLSDLLIEERFESWSTLGPTNMWIYEDVVVVEWFVDALDNPIQPKRLIVSVECLDCPTSNSGLFITLTTWNRKHKHVWRHGAFGTALLKNGDLYFRADNFCEAPSNDPCFNNEPGKIRFTDLEAQIDQWILQTDNLYGTKEDFLPFQPDWAGCDVFLPSCDYGYGWYAVILYNGDELFPPLQLSPDGCLPDGETTESYSQFVFEQSKDFIVYIITGAVPELYGTTYEWSTLIAQSSSIYFDVFGAPIDVLIQYCPDPDCGGGGDCPEGQVYSVDFGKCVPICQDGYHLDETGDNCVPYAEYYSSRFRVVHTINNVSGSKAWAIPSLGGAGTCFSGPEETTNVSFEYVSYTYSNPIIYDADSLDYANVTFSVIQEQELIDPLSNSSCDGSTPCYESGLLTNAIRRYAISFNGSTLSFARTTGGSGQPRVSSFDINEGLSYQNCLFYQSQGPFYDDDGNYFGSYWGQVNYQYNYDRIDVYHVLIDSDGNETETLIFTSGGQQGPGPSGGCDSETKCLYEVTASVGVTAEFILRFGEDEIPYQAPLFSFNLGAIQIWGPDVPDIVASATGEIVEQAVNVAVNTVIDTVLTFSGNPLLGALGNILDISVDIQSRKLRCENCIQ